MRKKNIEKKTKTNKKKLKYVSLVLTFKPWSSWKTKQNKKKSHLNKQTLEPNFYNDSVQIRKLTTICRRINRKSAVHSCLILSTKSSLTCFTTLYLTTAKYCEKNEIYEKKNSVFFSEFPKQHDYFDTRWKGKRKERESPDQNRKSKNIVILINYICLNLFE